MLFLAVLVAHAALPVVPLPKLNIDPKTITVSGISSGADFAVRAVGVGGCPCVQSESGAVLAGSAFF